MANTASRIAICHGWPSLSSIGCSATAPIVAAGTVAITISHAEPLVLVGDLAPARAAHHSARVAQEVVPEVGDHRHQRAEVQRDVEGLVEVRVLLEVVEVQHPWHEDQVPGRGDREELGQPLHDAEQQRLELVHERVSL